MAYKMASSRVSWHFLNLQTPPTKARHTAAECKKSKSAAKLAKKDTYGLESIRYYFSMSSSEGPHNGSATTIRVAHIKPCNCGEFQHKLSWESVEFSKINTVTDPENYNYGMGDVQAGKYSHETSDHVSVAVRHVPMKDPNLVAISYTWGEFNRRDLIVGHHEGSPDKTVKLNLGTEWNTWGFVSQLAEICGTDGAIWMDQICLPQKEEQIRETLAKIPDIYRALEVAIIMPGSPCLCLKVDSNIPPGDDDKIKEMWTACRELKDTKLKEEELYRGSQPDTYTLLGETQCCENYIGISSYFNRIWTKQEFDYATRVRLLWDTKTPAKCIGQSFESSGNEDNFLPRVNTSNPFQKQMALRGVESGKNQFDIATSLDDSHFQYSDGLRASVSSFLHGLDGPELDDTIKRFLLGELITMSQNQTSDGIGESTDISEHTSKKLLDFCIDLYSVGGMSRAATDLKDYVLALWVNLPYYNIPANRKTLRLAELLDEAILQMETKLGATFATLAPVTLFLDENHQDSLAGFWRPSHYLQESKVKSVNDIYGVIGSSNAMAIHNGRIPLRFNSQAQDHSASYFYQDVHGEATVSDVFITIKKAFDNLGLKELARYNNYMSQFFTHDVRTDATEVLIRLGLPEHFEYSQWKDMADMIVEPEVADCLFVQFLQMKEDYVMTAFLNKCPDIDHHAVLYPLVCHLLGLDHEVCLNSNLGIIFSPGEHARIGLRRREYEWPTRSNASSENERKFLAVGLEESERTLRDSFFLLEAVRYGEAADSQLPLYRVIGVWIPSNHIEAKIAQASILEWDSEISASRAPDDVEAWLN
ncbi:hypothetical protein AA313_de0203696 [Arthrobotrys entomopaga]|nr:hypothetical protein AA313_de0203696 [Arthrobotrys entomopaga]